MDIHNLIYHGHVKDPSGKIWELRHVDMYTSKDKEMENPIMVKLLSKGEYKTFDFEDIQNWELVYRDNMAMILAPVGGLIIAPIEGEK